MDSEFKRRVQAVQQSDSTQPATPAAPDEHSATRHNHALPSHQPGLLSPTSTNGAQSSRMAGGAIRTTVAHVRAARARGPPGTPTGPTIGRSVFGHGPSLSTANAARAASPRRSAGNNLVPPPSVAIRRSSNAGLPTTTATTAVVASSTSTGVKKAKMMMMSNTLSGSANNISGSSAISSNIISNNGTGDSMGNIDNLSNININADSAKNIANQNMSNVEGIAAKSGANIPSSSAQPNYETIGGSGLPPGLRSPGLRSPGLKSPSKKRYDRFIPQREGALAEQFELLPDTPSTPSRQRVRNMSITPNQASQVADHYKSAQNQAHDTVIANELMLTNTPGTHESSLMGAPRRLFTFASTSANNGNMPFDSPSRQIYAQTVVTQESRNILLSPKKAPRLISKVPFKVLDAPDLRDDFYLNLVDWSSQNVLGVGLGSCVYLWSALTSKVTQLCDLGENDSVTSINWISMGSHLAVGTDNGLIQIWDVQNSRRVRTMTGHTQRVGVLAWNDHILTSGSRDRHIYHRDVRSHEMWQHELTSHTGEVCGLKWNSAGTQLASGGNDNKLMVWERDALRPLYKFRDHNAAVKAIDWNPHQSGLLASGGGTADRHIRFWNTTTGVSVGATDTGSQVCNLAWSKTTNELVSTHGYSQNQVLVWKYPSMQQITSLSGHSYRVLYLALSPDGQTIVTGAGDETLRFWNVFQKSRAERREDDGLSGVVATIR